MFIFFVKQLSADLENLIFGEETIGTIGTIDDIDDLNVVFGIVFSIVDVNYDAMKRHRLVFFVIRVHGIIKILVVVIPTSNKVAHLIAGMYFAVIHILSRPFT